jgi:DNA-binding SARP family transcriptional activator
LVEFKILGPLEVCVGSQRLDLGGPRQQIVLATLLLSANTAVTVGRLEEAIYGEALPQTSRSQAQISVSSLRRLFASCGYPATITTHAQGYLIAADDGMLDSLQFTGLVTVARTARVAGEVDRAVAAYRDALRLWRGAALDGLDSQLLQAMASRLNEQRIAVNEDLLSLELDLGRHHELVGELTELVAENPLRERLRGQLMLALYRCDRTAEALAVYRETRRAMIDELGIEPGERLRQLEHSILTGDPALDPPAGPVSLQPPRPRVPSLLPADIADFTGRAGLVEQIGRHLTEWEAGRRAAPVMVLTGPGGAGKTSLAVRVAHEVAGHFADGQLFADLHAGAGSPVGAGRVLERFLRALGVPGPQVPEDLDERAEVYRDLVANRKLLLVLDDAAGESQVLPLLPGTPPAAVLITSRHRLSGLAGAAHVEVSVLEAETSLALLGKIAGPSRVQAEPSAAAAVAGHCGHLPLALRVAGARLAERPHWDIQQLADRLADETRRLDELRHGDLAVRASISLTYEGASEQARRLLRRLAMLDAPAFSGWVAAALLGQPWADAEDALDQLVSARLVETAGTGTGVHSQYRLHDLIRVYGRERLLSDDPPAEQDAALERALGAMLCLAAEANRLCTFGDQVQISSNATRWPLADQLTARLLADPLAWFERERVALVSGVRQAARAGLTDACWSLASATAVLFKSRAYFDDSREIHEIALQAATRAGHVRGQAGILSSRGSLLTAQQEYALARADLVAAAQLFHDSDDDHGLASVDADIAFLDRLTGRLEEAAQRGERALAVLRRTGDTKGAAFVLQNLAAVRLQLGELGPATDYLSEALRLAQAAGDSRTEAVVLTRLGEAYLQRRQPDRALETFERALTKVRDVKDPIGEAHLLQSVGVAKTRLGEFGDAHAALQRALELATALDERLAAARALLGLGELALSRGDHGQAVVLAGQAADAFGKLGARPDELAALTLRSEASTAAGCLRSAPQETPERGVLLQLAENSAARVS